MGFIKELKRRKVFRVAAVYLFVAWLLLQVSDVLVPALLLPAWFHSGVALLLILGFPVAILLAWALELTPEGPVFDNSELATAPTSKPPMPLVLISLLALALGYFIWDAQFGEHNESAGIVADIADSSAATDETGGGRETGGIDSGDSQAELPPENSLAVLSFVNMSNDEEQNYFSDGITEDIITSLAKVSGLIVVASNSSFTFENNSVDFRAIALALGVRHVLTGSLRRDGKRCRVTTKLIDARSGRTVWAERYDRETRDIFTVQSDIAAKVADELAVVLTADEQELLYRQHTDNLDAYDTYLRARRLSGPVNDPILRTKRRNLLEEAIELDPRFAGGYALLADTYAQSVRMGNSTTPDDDNERALSLARQAVEIDDKFAPGYMALAGAYLNNHEIDSAVAAAQEAVRLQPSDAVSHAVLGYVLHWAGNGEQVIEALQLARRLNPRDPRNVWLGYAQFTVGLYAETISTITPYYDYHARQGTSALGFLAAAHAAIGNLEQARAVMKTYLDARPGINVSNNYNAGLYAQQEDRDRLRGLLAVAGMPSG